MVDPYRIDGPATISFSGGRTSAYMLHEILQAYAGTLPSNIHVVFANTGKEREETLRFVHDCATHWNVRVRWVEWRNTPQAYEEVGYNSASRNGEPFARLIAKKKATPNWQMRFCTYYLKVETMTRFLRSLGFTSGTYQEVIGLRYDEGHRIFKMLERNEKYGRKCIAPLAKAKIIKRDINEFWRAQPFDLDLVDGEGNCDLCFLKGRSLRKVLIRRRPYSAQWWIEQERAVNGWFDSRNSYADLLDELKREPDMFEPMPDEEYDVECGLLCQP